MLLVLITYQTTVKKSGLDYLDIRYVADAVIWNAMNFDSTSINLNSGHTCHSLYSILSANGPTLLAFCSQACILRTCSGCGSVVCWVKGCGLRCAVEESSVASQSANGETGAGHTSKAEQPQQDSVKHRGHVFPVIGNLGKWWMMTDLNLDKIFW